MERVQMVLLSIRVGSSVRAWRDKNDVSQSRSGGVGFGFNQWRTHARDSASSTRETVTRRPAVLTIRKINSRKSYTCFNAKK